MPVITVMDVHKLPFEFESKQHIEAEAPLAIAYLERTDNMDLAEALGLVPHI